MSHQNPTRHTQGPTFGVQSNQYTKEKFLLLGYAMRVETFWVNKDDELSTLEDIIWSLIKSFGWTDEYCQTLLKEPPLR